VKKWQILSIPCDVTESLDQINNGLLIARHVPQVALKSDVNRKLKGRLRRQHSFGNPSDIGQVDPSLQFPLIDVVKGAISDGQGALLAPLILVYLFQLVREEQSFPRAEQLSERWVL